MPRQAVIDETGKRHGRLTVIERVENVDGGAARWLCRCDCGKHTLATGRQLRAGSKKSCGCVNVGRWPRVLQKRYPKIWRDESVVNVEDLEDIAQ